GPRTGTRSSSGRKERPIAGSIPIAGNRLPLTSIPIFNFGDAFASPATPAVTYRNAVRLSKLLVRSRISTYSGYDAISEVALNDSSEASEPTVIAPAGRGTGSGRSSSASENVNRAE